MTTYLRHKLVPARGEARVLLTVYPNDGRALPEEFKVSQAEARRFAWGLLADLTPAEAARAAAEEGLDLGAAALAETMPRSEHRPHADRAKRPLEPGCGRHLLLAALARRRAPATFPELSPALAAAGGESVQRNLITTTLRSGQACRINPGVQPALYAITDAGTLTLADLDARAAQARAADPATDREAA